MEPSPDSHFVHGLGISKNNKYFVGSKFIISRVVNLRIWAINHEIEMRLTCLTLK